MTTQLPMSKVHATTSVSPNDLSLMMEHKNQSLKQEGKEEEHSIEEIVGASIVDSERLPVDWLHILTFLAYLLAIFILSTGWMLLDICLGTVEPFSLHTESNLQLVSWGNLNICIDFSMKAFICFKIYKAFISPRYRAMVLMLGCAARMLICLIVRLPLYSKFGQYPGMNFLSMFENWMEMDYAVLIVCILCVVTLKPLVDVCALPVMMWRARKRHLQMNPKTLKKTLARKNVAEQKTVMGAVVLGWIASWCLFYFLSFFYSDLENIMFAVVFAPLLIVCYIVAGDLSIAVDETRIQPLTYSVGYLALFLWLLEMIPEFAAALLLGFNGVQDNVIQFFASLLYAFFMFIVLGISKPILRFAGSYLDNNVHMLMPMQFFKEFFAALFFLSIEINTLLFWGMLLPQMFLNYVEAVHGLGESYRFLKKIFHQITGTTMKPRATLSRRSEFHELIVKRKKLKEKVQSTLQDFIVQAATIFALVASYYTYFYFEWARKGEQAAFAFSSLYGITHIEQMNSSIFLVQFAVVLASRTVSTVLSLYVLNIKFKRFNNKLPNDDKQKKLGSQNLVAMEDELRVGGADAGLKPSMIPKLRIWRILVRHLDDRWWIFFLLVIVAAVRICTLSRGNLYYVNQEASNAILRLLTGNPNAVADSPSYWYVRLRQLAMG